MTKINQWSDDDEDVPDDFPNKFFIPFPPVSFIYPVVVVVFPPHPQTDKFVCAVALFFSSFWHNDNDAW